MQVHYDEGVAIHIGPEPCVGVRKDADEASVGEGRWTRGPHADTSPPLACGACSSSSVTKEYDHARQ